MSIVKLCKSSVLRGLCSALLLGTAWGSVAHAGGATEPPVNFTNSSSAATGSMIPNLLDSYQYLMLNNPVMTQNIQTVINMTQNRTDAQTLAAIHDDRTNQQYSVLNGLGYLTTFFMTGAGSSASVRISRFCIALRCF